MSTFPSLRMTGQTAWMVNVIIKILLLCLPKLFAAANGKEVK